MFRPYTVWLGLRYMKPRRFGYAGFVTLASAVGIALGVAVLITVLSVMNGFDCEIRQKIFSLTDQVMVTAPAAVDARQQFERQLMTVRGVRAVAAVVDGQGLLTASGHHLPVDVRGVDVSSFSQVSGLGNMMVVGSLETLSKATYQVVIGQSLAHALGVQLGDHVTLMTPEASASVIGVVPRFKQFTVSGIFHVGGNLHLDQHLALIGLDAAQRLYRLPAPLQFRLRVSDLSAAPVVAKRLRSRLPDGFQVRDWTQAYASFFHAIALEKTMMFLILSLIVAVAAFNLVSGLVMMVHAKRSEIAILRTLGVGTTELMIIFTTQGLSVCLAGLGLGVGLGLVMVAHATGFVKGLESLLGTRLISDAVYFVDYLPTALEGADVLHICLMTLAFCVMAVVYPARAACRFQPAKVLRHA